MTVDPYEWLELDSAETLAWEAEQDAATTAYLDAWPHRRHLRALLASFPASKAGHVPVLAGGAWFTSPDGRELTVDGTPLLHAVAGESLWDFWPSPDGALVVAAVARGSAEGGTLRLVEVESGATVGEELLFSTWTRLSWRPDSGGFYANAIDIRGDRLLGALWHMTRNGTAERVPIDDDGFDLYPDVTADGRFVMVSKGATRLRPAYLLDRTSNTARAFLPDLLTHTHGVVVDDAYLAVTMTGADRGRLVSIPLATPDDLAAWTELVSEGEAVMRAVSRVGTRLVISELVDGCSRLRVCNLDGSDLRVIGLPNGGVGVASTTRVPLAGVAMFTAVAGGATLTFRFSSPASPAVAYAYDVERDAIRPLDPQHAPSAHSMRVTSTAGDGTELAAWVTRRADLADQPCLPALVTVYGGWNLPNGPGYSPATAAFVASGGAVVHAIVRGGGERGESWWHAGRRERKQTTFDDLYAIVDDLVARGIVDPERIALQGGSAGGMAAAVAAIQRPDLFSVVAATAPALDLLRVGSGPGTAQATIDSMHDELGTDRDVLAAYSPYDNVHAHLPAMFVGATSDDIRTPSWHARKFVAKARSHRPAQPVLLRIWRDAGHGTNLPPANQISNDWLAFVMRELAVEPAEPLDATSPTRTV